MKNFLSINEFNKVREENKKLYESLDFSNNTGWSESLIGRLVNKVWSFGAKQYHKRILKDLKLKLDDEYLKGMLTAMAESNISAENIIDENNDLSLIEVKIKKIGETDISKYISPIEQKGFDIYFKIPKDTDYDDYETSISSPNKTIWKVLGKEYGNYSPIENEMEIETISPNGKNKNAYYISVSHEGKEPIVKFVNKSDENKYQLSLYDNVKNNTITFVLDLKDNEELLPALKNYKLINTRKPEQVIEDITNSEIKWVIDSDGNGENEEWNIKFLSNNNQKALPIGKEKEKQQALPPKKETDQSLLPSIGLIKVDDLKKEKIDLINDFNRIKNLFQQEIFNEASLTNIKNIISKIDTTKIVNDNIKKLIENLKKNIAEIKTFNEKDKVENIRKLFLKHYESIFTTNEYNIINESVISSIFGNKKDNYRQALKDYGKLELTKLDPQKMAKLFQNNDDLRKKAVNNVNKEALKEIQVRAGWLYDSKKYGEDAINKHYARVNFTVTEADRLKLKNIWELYIKESKKLYFPFFKDSTGVFPPILDPQALLKQDEKYAETLANDDKKGIVKNFTDILKYKELADDIMKSDYKLEPIPSGLVDGTYGIVEIRTSDRTLSKYSEGTLGMKVYFTEKHGVKTWIYLGMVNMKNIKEAVEDAKRSKKYDDSVLKDIIIKNDYSFKDTRDERINNVDDPEFRTYITNVINEFSKRNDPKIKNAPNSDKYVVVFSRNTRISERKDRGSALSNFVQAAIINDGSNYKQYITHIITPGQSSELVDYNNVVLSKKKEYNFEFNFIKISRINTTAMPIWGVENYRDIIGMAENDANVPLYQKIITLIIN